MDLDLIRSCYHPDAIDDHGDYVGGVDGFIEYARETCPSSLRPTTAFAINWSRFAGTPPSQSITRSLTIASQPRMANRREIGSPTFVTSTA